MGYPRPTASAKGKMKACDDEIGDENCPRVVDDSDAASDFSFDAIPREPLTHTIPGCTEDSTSYNVAANLSEPFEQPVAVPVFTSSLQEHFDPLHTDFLTPFVTSNAPNRSPSTSPQPRYRLTDSSAHRYSSDSMSLYSWEQPAPKPRYYAQALSVEDLKALARGEKNHNLQEWSDERLFTHHGDRRGLIPQAMPLEEKMSALAEIDHEMQQSQRAVAKTKEKVRTKLHIPRIKKTTDNAKDEEHVRTQFWQSSPTYDFRSSMLPPPLPRSTPTAQPEEYEEPRNRRYSHARAASSGDYFYQPSSSRTSAYNTRRISPLASPSGPSSSSSSNHVRSPLNQEVLFRADPATTFGSFLVPHKSGTGEVLAESKNAKKDKTPTASLSPSPKALAKVRRLTKMPSMPLLRKRSSGS